MEFTEQTRHHVIAIARAHFSFAPTDSPPLISCEYRTADEITPYDRWLVVFLTDPDILPGMCAVEVLADMTPRTVPLH